jgi:glycerol-3-phosphate dehydrogenase
MAVDILDRATNRKATDRAEERSEQDPLPGGDMVSLEQTEHDAIATCGDAAVGERLARAYGSRWRNVWSYAQRDSALGARLSDQLPYLLAEVAHAVEREAACTFADVLVRRTHLAFETRDHGVAVAERIAPLMAALLQWNDERVASELNRYRAETTRLFAIDEPK